MKSIVRKIIYLIAVINYFLFIISQQGTIMQNITIQISLILSLIFVVENINLIKKYESKK